MLSVLAALASRVGFSFLSVFWKFYRNQGVSTKSIMGVNGVILLPWLPVTLYFLWSGWLPFNQTYLLYIVLFLVAIFTNHFLAYYLYKFQGLTASDSFRTVFASIIALVIDIAFFNESFSLYILLGCFLLLVSATILQFHKQENSSVSVKDMMTILLLNCLVGAASVFEIVFYKAGLQEIEHNITAHFIFTCAVIAIVYTIWGGRPLWSDIKSKAISLKAILGIAVIMSLSLITYTYAVGALPVVVMVLVRVVGSGIFAIFDVKFKEFHLDRKTIAALAGVLSGLVLIALAKIS